MELQKHIAHPHPLLFNKDSKDDRSLCKGCWEWISGPCYRCEVCRFYFHKKCAEAPMQIDVHPLHSHQYPLIHFSSFERCSLCLQLGKEFMYHCSPCNFFLHIDCALLLRDAARNFIKTKFPFAHQHPLILLPIANDNMHLRNSWCNGCSAHLLDADAFACLDCHTFFHKTCVEMPVEINHPHHRKHQLILEFDSNRRDCNLCERKHGGLFYRCSLCNVCFHCKCAFPPPIIEDTSHHEHPFILLLRPNSFTCDACGTQGENVSCICSTCNILVHRKCTSLPLIIAINLHHHPLYRNFFLCLSQHDSRSWECQICFQKVNLEYGSYYCSKQSCNYVVHVNCAIENKELYGVIEFKNQHEAEKHFEMLASFYNIYGDCITNKINVGEDGIAAEIKHISHGHNLTFSDEIKDKKHCHGCVLPILSSFYYCSDCDFFLHKECAEFPRRLKRFGADPVALYINGIFVCYICKHLCSGFFYESIGFARAVYLCLRCAGVSHSFTYKAHEPHHIFFDAKYEGCCSACGSSGHYAVYRSKDGKFALDRRCLALPRTFWHECDEHTLSLAYQDDSGYPPQHYCDICEEMRDSKYWFYQCKDCNTTAHPQCVLGKYPFIKFRTTYISEKHPHPLTFVQNMYYYLQCDVCGKPCQDLSLECIECAEHGRKYTTHWECIKPNPSSGGILLRRDTE